jgi:hypothetical protein
MTYQLFVKEEPEAVLSVDEAGWVTLRAARSGGAREVFFEGQLPLCP